jgi:anti-sigma factor RsiW
MSHLDEGQLTALLDHELTAAERSAVEAHLMACEECRRLFEEVKAFATEADGLVTAIELPARGPVRRGGARPATRKPLRRPVTRARVPPALEVPGHRAAEPSGRRAGTVRGRERGWPWTRLGRATSG